MRFAGPGPADQADLGGAGEELAAGVPASKIEEAQAALREFGLRDDLKPKS
jgi:hypothetical protein